MPQFTTMLCLNLASREYIPYHDPHGINVVILPQGLLLEGTNPGTNEPIGYVLIRRSLPPIFPLTASPLSVQLTGLFTRRNGLPEGFDLLFELAKQTMAFGIKLGMKQIDTILIL